MSESALADLETLIEVTESTPVTDDFGEKERTGSDLVEYAAELRAPDASYVGEFCSIYSPESMGTPFATVEFGWEDSTPTSEETAGMSASYETGAYAYVDENNPATTGFRCPISAEKEDEFLSGRLFTFDITGSYDLRMSIINSISWSIAEELGCLDEADLSESAPERTSP